MNIFQIVTLSLIGFSVFREIKGLWGKPLVQVMFGLRWVPVFALAFIVIAFPEVSAFVAHIFGITRGVDLVIYGSILWLLYSNHGYSKRLEKVESSVVSLVRKVALNDACADDSAVSESSNKN